MKNAKKHRPLLGQSFHNSRLLSATYIEWPNSLLFLVHSTLDNVKYEIKMSRVLEFHYIRTGTGNLEIEEGIPLDDIYVTEEEEYQYWMNKIEAFAEQGFDDGSAPICMECASRLFANRRRKLLTRDRNMGILVACREVEIVAISADDSERSIICKL